jgi:hypothetical protein
MISGVRAVSGAFPAKNLSTIGAGAVNCRAAAGDPHERKSAVLIDFYGDCGL